MLNVTQKNPLILLMCESYYSNYLKLACVQVCASTTFIYLSILPMRINVNTYHYLYCHIFPFVTTWVDMFDSAGIFNFGALF